MSGGIVAGEVASLIRIPNITRFLSCRAIAEGLFEQNATVFIFVMLDTGSVGEKDARP